jgi:hypothetical protein
MARKMNKGPLKKTCLGGIFPSINLQLTATTTAKLEHCTATYATRGGHRQFIDLFKRTCLPKW